MNETNCFLPKAGGTQPYPQLLVFFRRESRWCRNAGGGFLPWIKGGLFSAHKPAGDTHSCPMRPIFSCQCSLQLCPCLFLSFTVDHMCVFASSSPKSGHCCFCCQSGRESWSHSKVHHFWCHQRHACKWKPVSNAIRSQHREIGSKSSDLL